MAKSKVSDLLYQSTATGVVVKDKSRMRRDDYASVAHINKQRQVTYLRAGLTQQQKDAIEYYANNEDPENGGTKVFDKRPAK